MPWPNNVWRAYKKRWLRERLWHIQGEALDAYSNVETAIENALQAYDVLHEGCKVYNQILGIRPYMVGRHLGNVRPCIFIYCREKVSLKRVCEAVEGNREWQLLRTRYPRCFDVHPVLGTLSPMNLGPEPAEESRMEEVLYDHTLLRTVYGASISFKNCQHLRSAILGGFVVLGDDIYGLTVAHCIHNVGDEDTLRADLGRTEAEGLSPSDLDLLFPPTEQGPSESATNDEPHHRLSFDADSGVSLASAMSVAWEHESQDLEHDQAKILDAGHHLNESQSEILGHIQHVQSKREDSADWALVKVTSTKFLSCLESQTPKNLVYLERMLHLRLGGIQRSRAPTPGIFLCISGTEYAGYLDAGPCLIRLPGHQNLVRLLEVTIPSFCFREFSRTQLIVTISALCTDKTRTRTLWGLGVQSKSPS